MAIDSLIIKNLLVLGIKSPNTSLEEIKNAYRTLVKKYHPDISKQNTAAKFIEVQQAFDYLENNFKPSNIFSYSVNPTPMSKPSDREKYFRFLTSSMVIQMPERILTRDIVINVMYSTLYDTKEFRLLFDKGTEFPKTIKVHNPPLTIKILVDGVAW